MSVSSVSPLVQKSAPEREALDMDALNPVLAEASAEERVKAVLEVLAQKFIKRGVSLRSLDSGEPYASGKEYRIEVNLKNGISSEDAKKVAAEYSGQVYKQFALLAQFEGDAHNRRIALYDCVVTARPEIAAKTGKTKTPDTIKVKFAARPRASDNLVQMYTKSDTDPTVYSSWFTAVQEPAAA